jgi:LuxR family maltose regulon positive regulatory protein
MRIAVRRLAAPSRISPGKPFEPLVRQRLLARFDRALGLPVALVVAPAGFGKSVVARSYLAASNAPSRVFAVRSEAAPELATSLGTLPGFLGTVVIDDLQHADDSGARLLIETIERGDEGVKWLLIARDASRLPVASWLAYGRMDLPIDERDLRFTEDEALALARTAATDVSEADVRALWSMTGGWPAALALALRLRANTADLAQVTAGTRETVYGYLTEQIFGGLTGAEQRFLFEAALVPPLSAEQWAAGGDVAAAMLERLAKVTGFLNRQPDGTFALDNLFREYLEHELSLRGKTLRDDVARSAGRVLEGVGRLAPALGRYAAAGDGAAVARVLGSHGFDLVAHGHVEAVAAALASLGAREREGPMLVALDAEIKAQRGFGSDAEALYRLALERETGAEQRLAITERFAASLAVHGRYDAAQALLVGTDTTRLADRAMRARLLALHALVDANVGSLESSRHALEAALELQATLADDVRIVVLLRAAQAAHASGALAAAERHALAALNLAETAGLHASAARCALVAGDVTRDAGDAAKASDGAQRALRHAEAAGDASAQLAASALLYALAAERGDREALTDLDEGAAPLAVVALRAAWTGDFAAAYRLTDDAAERALYGAAAHEREAAEGAMRAATERLPSLDADTGPLGTRATLARLWLALAALILGRAAVANNLLRDLERQARRLPAGMRALCTLVRAAYVHAETGAGHRDVAAALVAVREAGLGGYAALVERLPLPETPSSPRIGSLTRTEVRVLQLLATGGSSKTIGADLGRSSQTIDAHVKAIVRKLNCSGRREALSLAREHGIV